MTARQDGTLLRLEGDCRLEDADAVTAVLQRGGIRAVDLSACSSLHAAVLQALVAYGVVAEGAPRDAFVRDIVMPALADAKRTRLS